MKIVYICDFFHPYAGYHPNLLTKYWTRFGHKVYMVTSEMEKVPRSLLRFFGDEGIEEKDAWFRETYGVEIIRIPLIQYISGRSVYSRTIYKTIRAIDPDVIFVNGNDTLIGIELTLRYPRLKSGLVMDNHMLEMASNNKLNKHFRRFYKHIITPRILKYHIPVIRTQNDQYIQKCLGIPIEKSPWISFGTDMTIFHPDKEQRQRFREQNGINNHAFVFIYAGKLLESKGASLLSKVSQMPIKTDREIVFLIIGNAEGEYGENLEQQFAGSPYRILRFPTQKYFDLPQFYQAADVALFPKQCSLSFYDVQACGLPVIFEDNNVNIDRGSHHNAITYQSNDAEDFREKIEWFANLPQKELNEYSSNATEFVSKTYNYETKAREYIPYLEQQAKQKHRIKEVEAIG